RLHFGLFHLPSHEAESWPNRHGEPSIPPRRFGGVGLMIDAPGIELTVSPSATWQADGPRAERALAFARRFAEATPEVNRPCHVTIARGAPEHVGLGTGTQLGLAVANAITWTAGLKFLDNEVLAKRIGRGERSGLGVSGFAHGGFLVEAGQRKPGTIGPL